MIELFGDESEVSFESLTHQHNVISLEALNVSQMFEVNQSKLPRFLDDTVRYIKNRLNIFSPSVVNVDERKLLPYLKQVDYVTMMPLRVVTLERFSSTWMDYTALLGNAHVKVMVIQKELLTPFETFLGTSLNNPDHMKSIGNLANLPKRANKGYDDIAKGFNAAFQGKLSTHLTYGDVVKRHADVTPVCIGLNNLNNDFSTLSRSNLIKQVNRISELLSIITEKMKNGDNEAMSGNFTKALGDLTYAVAQDVEFYTTYGYRLESFTKSLKDSVDQLVKFLSK